MIKIIFILAIIFGIMIIPGSADLFGDMSQEIVVYNQNTDKVPGVIKNLLGNEEIYGIIDLNDGSKLEVKAVTKDARIIQFAKVGTKITPQNTFYAGIKWNSDAIDVLQQAHALDASLVHSYENTDKWPCSISLNCYNGLFGMYDVYMAYSHINTEKNHLDNIEGDGYHKIVFGHSGGTQTLLKKLQYGVVTADYAVFIAPALINQKNIEDILKSGNVKKKVVIVESTEDMLYKLEAEYKRIPIFPTHLTPTVTFYSLPHDLESDFSKIPIYKEVAIDISSYLNDNGVDPSQVREERFWVGGSDRKKQMLFNNSSNVIVIHDIDFGTMKSMDVHHELLVKTIQWFLNGDYPFDGSIDGLKKVDGKLSQEVTPTLVVTTNEKTIRNIMDSSKPADTFLDAYDNKDITIEAKGIVKSILFSLGTIVIKIAKFLGIV